VPWIVEHGDGIDEINPVLGNVRLPFALVPFETLRRIENKPGAGHR